MAKASELIGPPLPNGETVLPSTSAHSPSTLQSSLQKLTFLALPTRCSASELAMFRKIVATGCSIKSQQRGEPDLTEAELCEELHAILQQRPGLFLMRFGKYLDESDLSFFESASVDDYEVSFRVKELQQSLQKTSKARSKAVKNRRYMRLEQLMSESDYFTDEEMQQRNPLLFEYYIGQFLSEEERLKIGEDKSEMKLSSMILKNMEVDQRVRLLNEQRSEEEDQIEESDSSSDGDTSDIAESGNPTFPPMKLSSTPETAVREKLMLRREFLSAMQTNFLEGKDKDFDYSEVDNNEKYDSLEMRGKDSEDDYFDAEEPSWCEVEARSNSSGGMELSTDDGEVSASSGGHELATETNTFHDAGS